MNWPALQRFIQSRGWGEEECRKLLLERFGAGYDENLAPQYIAHLQGFYDNNREEVAQAAQSRVARGGLGNDAWPSLNFHWKSKGSLGGTFGRERWR